MKVSWKEHGFKVHGTNEPKANLVWQKMYEQQTSFFNSGKISTEFLKGFDICNFPKDKIPKMEEFSEKLFPYTDWKLTETNIPYLSKEEWFNLLSNNIFPVTNYIRTMEDLEFTPLPDLFHEYFGHLPAMFVPKITPFFSEFTRIFLRTQEEHQEQLRSIWWYTIEYGILLENGQNKAFGAGILSSNGDLKKFINNEFIIKPATFEEVINTPSSPHISHEKLFSFKGIDEFWEFLRIFEKKYCPKIEGIFMP